jgi:hypothetical protein
VNTAIGVIIAGARDFFHHPTGGSAILFTAEIGTGATPGAPLSSHWLETGKDDSAEELARLS